jgi:transcriptional regulator with XRE-family HTH domain
MKTLLRPSKQKLRQPEPNERFWLGVNLHRLRKERHLTQEQLAKAVDVSARRLRDIENAVPESNPGLNTIMALASALKVGVLELLGPGSEQDLVEV